jgi:hypothetical protein
MKAAIEWLTLKPLTAAEVKIEVKVEPETDIGLEGNVMVSGDDAADKAAEQSLRERLDRGDELAWCCVIVEASWQGYKGFDSLGGVTLDNSEADLESLVTEHGMRDSALEALNKAVTASFETLKERIQ